MRFRLVVPYWSNGSVSSRTEQLPYQYYVEISYIDIFTWQQSFLGHLINYSYKRQPSSFSCTYCMVIMSSQWRHIRHMSLIMFQISSRFDCFFNSFVRLTSKSISKLSIMNHLWGESMGHMWIPSHLPTSSRITSLLLRQAWGWLIGVNFYQPRHQSYHRSRLITVKPII